MYVPHATILPTTALGAIAALTLCGNAAGSEAGFVPLFDGATLKGWDGNPKLWRVDDGAIVGETTDTDPIDPNEFLVWHGEVADFVLRLRFRVADRGVGNSGVQYRSSRLRKKGRWVVGGYQADIERTNKHMGILYEERGRGILAACGQKVRLVPSGKGVSREALDSLGDPAMLLEGVSPGEWQQLDIVARRNRLEHRINGRTTVVVFDEDLDNASRSGVIALQLHRGPAMRVDFKDIRLKHLNEQRPTPE